MEHPRVGVGVFIRNEGKILIGKRRGEHGGGYWQLAGGHLENGESFEECARREALEETNLEIENIRHLTTTNDVFPDGKHYVTVFMVGDYRSGDLCTNEPDKCEGWEWRTWEELPEPLFLPLEHVVESGITPFDI